MLSTLWHTLLQQLVVSWSSSSSSSSLPFSWWDIERIKSVTLLYFLKSRRLLWWSRLVTWIQLTNFLTKQLRVDCCYGNCLVYMQCTLLYVQPSQTSFLLLIKLKPFKPYSVLLVISYCTLCWKRVSARWCTGSVLAERVGLQGAVHMAAARLGC